MKHKPATTKITLENATASVGVEGIGIGVTTIAPTALKQEKKKDKKKKQVVANTYGNTITPVVYGMMIF